MLDVSFTRSWARRLSIGRHSENPSRPEKMIFHETIFLLLCSNVANGRKEIAMYLGMITGCVLSLTIATAALAGGGGTGTSGSGGGNGAAAGSQNDPTTDTNASSTARQRDCHEPKASQKVKKSDGKPNTNSNDPNRDANCPH